MIESHICKSFFACAIAPASPTHVFVEYKITYVNSETRITTYVPVYDYIVSIMRCSVIGKVVG